MRTYHNCIPRVRTIWSLPEFFLFKTMTIKLNGKEQPTEAATLQELAKELGLPEKGVAMAVAKKMVQRQTWASTPLEEGSEVIIIKAACGG